MLTWPTDVNVIKPKVPNLKGHKKNAICKRFDVNLLKKVGKKYNNCTINDIVMGMASVSLKKYMLKRGDNQNTVNAFMPFSMR